MKNLYYIIRNLARTNIFETYSTHYSRAHPQTMVKSPSDIKVSCKDGTNKCSSTSSGSSDLSDSSDLVNSLPLLSPVKASATIKNSNCSTHLSHSGRDGNSLVIPWKSTKTPSPPYSAKSKNMPPRNIDITSDFCINPSPLVTDNLEEKTELKKSRLNDIEIEKLDMEVTSESTKMVIHYKQVLTVRHTTAGEREQYKQTMVEKKHRRTLEKRERRKMKRKMAESEMFKID